MFFRSPFCHFCISVMRSFEQFFPWFMCSLVAIILKFWIDLCALMFCVATYSFNFCFHSIFYIFIFFFDEVAPLFFLFQFILISFRPLLDSCLLDMRLSVSCWIFDFPDEQRLILFLFVNTSPFVLLLLRWLHMVCSFIFLSAFIHYIVFPLSILNIFTAN